VKSRRCDDNQQITVSHFCEHKRLHFESSKQNYDIVSLRAIIKVIFIHMFQEFSDKRRRARFLCVWDFCGCGENQNSLKPIRTICVLWTQTQIHRTYSLFCLLTSLPICSLTCYGGMDHHSASVSKTGNKKATHTRYTHTLPAYAALPRTQNLGNRRQQKNPRKCWKVEFCRGWSPQRPRTNWFYLILLAFITGNNRKQ